VLEVYGMNDWFAEGAVAEYCLTLPKNICGKPTSSTHEAAATVPIAALTAWQGLLDRAMLQTGERILVHGGAGAVGLFVVQLAHRRGAYVTATVSAGDIDFVKQLGANEVIDYRAVRFEEVVESVDVIFDTVGGETLGRSWSLLKTAGRMVTIAADSEGASDRRVKDAFFIVEPNQRQLREVAHLIDAGHLKTFIKAVVALDGAAAAYDGSLKGGRGKIVVAIPAVKTTN
jgi:NADPH:quinone reductase-like Zn-dependent oxidoreductase